MRIPASLRALSLLALSLSAGPAMAIEEYEDYQELSASERRAWIELGVDKEFPGVSPEVRQKLVPELQKCVEDYGSDSGVTMPVDFIDWIDVCVDLSRDGLE